MAPQLSKILTSSILLLFFHTSFYHFFIINMSFDAYIHKLSTADLLTIKELKSLTSTVMEILIQEPNVMELKGEYNVIGDIHGQFYDLLHMLQNIVPKMGEAQYIFLGDYVDRGYHSIETICLLLAYKCKYPGKVILLRGNHETSSLTKIYGFYDEVNKKYGNPSPWKLIVEAFMYFPLAAVVNDSLMCVHGGLSPKIPSIHDICAINRVKEIPEIGAMSDLVWSDPEPSISSWAVSNRGAGYLFPHQAVKEFLHLNNLQMISRAHQLVEEGYSYPFEEETLVTVWSAPNYCYRCGNKASVLKIAESGQKQYIVFEPSEQTPKANISYEYILPYFL